jgi:hypothetical protein
MRLRHMTLKSLAHPDWPYTGTPWEWRGFVHCAPVTPIRPEWVKRLKEYENATNAVYQKQNFGPELK